MHIRAAICAALLVVVAGGIPQGPVVASSGTHVVHGTATTDNGGPHVTYRVTIAATDANGGAGAFTYGSGPAPISCMTVVALAGGGHRLHAESAQVGIQLSIEDRPQGDLVGFAHMLHGDGNCVRDVVGVFPVLSGNYDITQA